MNEFEVVSIRFYKPAQVCIKTPSGHRYVDVLIRDDREKVVLKEGEELPLGVGAGTFEKRVLDFLNENSVEFS